MQIDETNAELERSGELPNSLTLFDEESYFVRLFAELEDAKRRNLHDITTTLCTISVLDVLELWMREYFLATRKRGFRNKILQV